MDLSQDMQDILKTMKVLIKENIQNSNNSPRLPLDRSSNAIANDLIDINNIDFSSDENWLYQSPINNSNVKDLKAWLYQDVVPLKGYDFHSNHLLLIRELAQNDTKKIIDSRTFTRPKKRLSRPSIEKYNDGYFGMNKFESEGITDESENDRTVKLNDDRNHEKVIVQQQPLKFDLSQPTTSSIFEKIATAPDVDSFQNMSPPSLINSMCSSTFTNLMENSMIKNDPLLREISVTDYTESMLQDYDPPLFRSISDSCSSINLDNPESFIKQNSEGTLNNIYKKSIIANNDNSLNETYITDNNSSGSMADGTYLKESSSDVSSNDVCGSKGATTENSTDDNTTTYTLNGTYRKNFNSKINETFKKIPLNNTNDDLNSTVTYNNDCNRFANVKRRSYVIDSTNGTHAVALKRNSCAHSVGSSDSLDLLSSLSSSSRDSNKMLNMAEVDAIVLQQEQSLHVMSTPKPTSKIISKLWEHSNISPVIPIDKNLSDSELSSNDEYKTVRSNFSPSDSNSSAKTINKSLENVSSSTDLKFSSKSLNVNGVKPVSNNKIPHIKGSYPNLKTVGTTLKGSYTNLKRVSSNINSTSSITSLGSKGSTTNLKTMSSNLKGSYTQLKPVLLNLPCTDSNIKACNSNSKVMKRPYAVTNDNNIQIAEVTPTLRDFALSDQVKQIPNNCADAKPQIKASGLRRPISSIPRPSMSKIPGLKSRSLTSRSLSRPSSKYNLDYDF